MVRYTPPDTSNVINAILIAPHPRTFEIILSTQFALAEFNIPLIMAGPSGVHQWVIDNAVGIYVDRIRRSATIVRL